VSENVSLFVAGIVATVIGYLLKMFVDRIRGDVAALRAWKHDDVEQWRTWVVLLLHEICDKLDIPWLPPPAKPQTKIPNGEACVSVPTIPVVDAVLGCAIALDPVQELQGQQNRGYFVDAINDFCGSPRGSAWCLCFVHYVGIHALGSTRWPLGRNGSCDVLLQLAKKLGVLRESPVRGAVFLRLNPDNSADATHAGFVDRVLADGSFKTVEGNSNNEGAREGQAVVRLQRGGAHSRSI